MFDCLDIVNDTEAPSITTVHTILNTVQRENKHWWKEGLKSADSKGISCTREYRASSANKVCVNKRDTQRSTYAEIFM